MSDIKIRVENGYSDGHESEAEYTVPHDVVAYALLDGIDQLWDELWLYTGDGHGADEPDLGWWHQITITEAPDWPELVGQSYESSGN